MRKLIVNADDFGLTEKVNQAIVDGHRGGIITSTTLMATGEAFESAAAMARQSPRLGVGLHWNLTEGKPVSPVSSIPSLVNDQGMFARTPGHLWRAILFGPVNKADVETELRAQIEKLVAAGISPTHLDSHKHLHALPALGRLAIKVARECGIPAIRVPAENSAPMAGLMRRYPRSFTRIIRQRLSGRVLGWMSRGWSRPLGSAEIARAAHFYGLTATGYLDERILHQILTGLPDGTSELMCHPGFVDSALERTPTRLLQQREIEFRGLTSPAIRRLVQELGIQLVHYGEIAATKTVRGIEQRIEANPDRLSA